MELMRTIAICLIMLFFLTAIYAYPKMPDKMASHWNIKGEVDGYMPKILGVLLIPFISLTLLGLFLLLPMLDPMKQNYRFFIGEYNSLVALMIGFFYYLYLLTLIFNMGYVFDLTRFLSPAFGILFFYIGIVIKKVKQNWFVGIRTPWTLSSEKVWDKTHRISGDLFQASGIVALLGIVFPLLLLASLAVLFATAVFAIVYSYLEFRKEKR